MLQQATKLTSLVLLCIVLIVMIVGGITYYVSDRAAREEANQAKSTLFASGVENPYVDQNGIPTSLDLYLGKIIVVNSWASWSPFSVQELPDFNTVASEYKDKNVIVLAVNRNENRDTADRFLATLPPMSTIKIVTDTADYFYNAVGGYAMPETLIYNELGTIVHHHKGVLTAAELRLLLESLKNTDS